MKALGDGVVRDDMSLRLPGYTSHGPVVPRESRDPGAVVRSTTEDWEARAAAADRAAELLQEAMEGMRRSLAQNYFGACCEGERLYSRARLAIEAWRSNLTTHRSQLAQLSANCRAAGQTINQTDHDVSGPIDVVT